MNLERKKNNIYIYKAASVIYTNNNFLNKRAYIDNMKVNVNNACEKELNKYAKSSASLIYTNNNFLNKRAYIDNMKVNANNACEKELNKYTKSCIEVSSQQSLNEALNTICEFSICREVTYNVLKEIVEYTKCLCKSICKSYLNSTNINDVNTSNGNANNTKANEVKTSGTNTIKISIDLFVSLDININNNISIREIIQNDIYNFKTKNVSAIYTNDQLTLLSCLYDKTLNKYRYYKSIIFRGTIGGKHFLGVEKLATVSKI
ncbi:hypothetical protein BCR32DRAFT_295721 [Anaeromyces robustus]|uniref:Uncharacterized protein n=1 Tax=Anaeromyces robustus TaxID=1754192 RepID=A0A1Y1WV43_9FUNG|nr:hypothetical protein BCR32DRAFT_295721 [Anaeromyces robustus]|eukprot:ORX77275.1 hypothetical protein BCR32DRAFT_295721 [Anaeromyces robustus]